MSGSPWSSLELVKVLVSALTPLTVLGVGILVARVTRRVEDLRWANQQVIGQRLTLYADIGPKINQLLCFATFVGRWKELSPAQVLATKRDLDEILYANRPIFSQPLFSAYSAYMSALFAMYATVNGDALLRVPMQSQWGGDRRTLPWWRADMTALFAVTGTSTIEQVQQAHAQLEHAFRRDLYVVSASSHQL